MTEAVRTWRTGGGRLGADGAEPVARAGDAPHRRPLRTTLSGTVERVVVAELNLGDFRREVERVIYRWAAETRRRPPEIVGINRVDGELITPGSS